MGYRSQVKGRIYGPQDKVDVLIAKARLTGSRVFEKHENALKIISVKTEEYSTEVKGYVPADYGCVCLDWDDVKWYNAYNGFTESWHQLETEAESLELNWEFTRVGEEYGDITYNTGGDDCQHWIQPYTTISDDTPEPIEGETT